MGQTALLSVAGLALLSALQHTEAKLLLVSQTLLHMMCGARGHVTFLAANAPALPCIKGQRLYLSLAVPLPEEVAHYALVMHEDVYHVVWLDLQRYYLLYADLADAGRECGCEPTAGCNLESVDQMPLSSTPDICSWRFCRPCTT